MKEDKILVEIAAYCDPDLLNTVQSAIVQAENPSRVHFAICYQSDNLDDLEKLKQIKNCKVKHLKKSEAKGPCYARNICQKMIEDEKYVFQIDAHMRFTKGWDTKMIKQLMSIGDPKAIISFYPPSLTEEMDRLPIDDKIFDKPSSTVPIKNYTNKFNERSNYFLYIISSPFDATSDDRPLRSPFIAAGNFFSFAEAHKTVLHNPKMYYSGDELSMSIRYYTHGWNNYCPNRCYVYHKYLRKNRLVPNSKTNNMQKEEELMKQLLNQETKDEYGLGSERTLKEFEEFAGIDFTKKIIYKKCETGQFEDDSLQNKVSYLQLRAARKKESLEKKEKIEVIIIDLRGNYQKCIESCLKNTIYNKIEFIVGTVNQIKIDEKTQKQNHIKKIIYFDEDDDNTHYSMMLSKLIKYLDDCYTMIIDSSYRFAPEWDKTMCESIKICGKNSAITCWIYYALNNKSSVYQYVNIIRELDSFNDYLPTLKTKAPETVKFGKFLYRTPFIADGFLFCNSNVLKRIKPDPNLSYNEQKYIYAARLWTHGIDLYYAKMSCFFRTIDETQLDNGMKHYDVLCGLMGRNNSYGIKLNEDYKYSLGEERPLWGWYDYIGYDCSNDNELVL